MRDEHFESLLKTYHSALSQIVRRLGSDPEQLFSYSDLQDELRTFGDFALFCAPMILQMRIASSEHIADMDNYAARLAEGETVKFVSQYDDKTQNLFEKLINGAVTDIVEYGYVQLE